MTYYGKKRSKSISYFLCSHSHKKKHIFASIIVKKHSHYIKTAICFKRYERNAVISTTLTLRVSVSENNDERIQEMRCDRHSSKKLKAVK